MRVGAAILLPLLALFGFGFFLANTFNLSRELIESRNQFAQSQAERQAIEAQYQALLQEKSQLTNQVSSLAVENENLRRQVNTLEVQRLSLTNQIEGLQVQLDLVKKAHPLFTWLVSTRENRESFALLVVPMLPLSLGAAYLLSHRKVSGLASRSTIARGQVPTTFQAVLTREEFHIIARYRKLRSQGRSSRELDNALLE